MSESLFSTNEQSRRSGNVLPGQARPIGRNFDADRKFRQATLNLLEDAIQARSETVAVNRELQHRIAEHERAENALVQTQRQLQEAIIRFERLKTDFNERVRERTREFEQRERRLQESTAQIKRTEMTERKRLARLLHDQVQQLLIAAKIQASVLADDLGLPEENSIGKVISLLDDAVNVTRDVSVQLTPPLLQDEGLPAATEWLVSRTMQQFGLSIKAQIDPSADPSSPEGRDILFQAAQEFLLNAAKHSGCKRLKLRLSHSKKQITLKVSDSGVGFDVAKLETNGSFGLFGVGERLRSIAGQFQIDSTTGKGTTATAMIPSVPLATHERGRTIESPRENQSISDTRSITRVVLIDDHQVVREGLTQYLHRHPGIQVVGEASTGIAGMQLASELQPDVILMDVNMPQMGGIEATRRILASAPQIKIIGLSLEDSPVTRRSFLDAGAAEYLTKDSPLEEIVQAIRDNSETSVTVK